jgi:hypothetical protein
VKRKTRHTFIEKATGAILDSYSISLRDEDDQLVPQVGDTIERYDQIWTITAMSPVAPDLEDPDHPEAAVEIVCEHVKAEGNGGKPTVPPAPGV